MYNSIIYLCAKVKSSSRDEYGDVVYTLSKSQVFAKVKSVTRSEFYSAQQAGINPQIVFEIADYFDYSDQPIVEYESKFYKVIRTYRTGSSLQIICAHNDTEE